MPLTAAAVVMQSLPDAPPDKSLQGGQTPTAKSEVEALCVCSQSHQLLLLFLRAFVTAAAHAELPLLMDVSFLPLGPPSASPLNAGGAKSTEVPQHLGLA